MLVSFKPGVLLEGLKPQILIGLLAVYSVFSKYEYDLVITSGSDGQHMEGSKHYSGGALDIRSKHITNYAVKQKILSDCTIALGENFTFILESPGENNEHFHLQLRRD